MKIRKIIAALMTLAVLLSATVQISWAADNSDTSPDSPVYAQANWDGKPNVNIKRIQYREGSARATTVEKGGEQVLIMRGGGPVYTLIDPSEDLFPVSDKSESVAVTVRYYDEGTANAFFTLWFTGPTGGAEISDKVTMTNTKKFLEYTFRLDECYFNNSTLGMDFVLGMWSTKWGSSRDPVYIQSVRIERSFPQHPIKTRLNTGSMGNIFDIDDDKTLNVDIKNITDNTSLEIEGEYEVTTFDGQHINSGSLEKITLEAQQIKSVALPNDIYECGVYFLRLKMSCNYVVDGEKKHYESEWEKKRFGVINKRDMSERPNPIMQTTLRLDIDNRESIQNDIIQMMADIGMSGSREQTSWGRYYSADGKFKEWALAPGFKFAGELGMNKMMALQMGGPPSGGNGYIPETPEAIEAYCDYAEHIVTDYENVNIYEVWNEPNILGSGFNIRSVSATGYTELVKAVYKRIKAVRPEVKVASLSTAQIQYSYIEEAIKAGILDYTDIITVHPYDWEDSGAESRTKNNLYRERLHTLRNRLDELGYSNVEIMFSEMGVRSGTDLASEELQAASNVQMFGISQGEGFVDGIYLFQFINEGLESDPDAEMHWGILHNKMEPEGAYTPKLCYVALAGYNKFLSDAEPAGKILRDEMSVYTFKRNADGKDVAMLWSDNDSDAIGLDLGVNEVDVYDMYSNHIGTMKSDDGTYSFSTSFEPMYVVGNFSKTEECEPAITVNDGRKHLVADDYYTFVIMDNKGRNLDVSIKARDGIEVVSNTQMINGNANIRVHTKADATKENALEVKVYDGENLIYAAKYHAIIEEPMSLSSSIVKYHENNDTRYLAELKLTNTANENSITGTASVDFTSIGGNKETRKFFDVPAGKTVTLNMNIPEQFVNRTFNVNARVELDNGYVSELPMNLTRNMAIYTKTSPDITGKLDYSQWSGGDWFAADTSAQTRSLPNWTKEDCSMTGKVKWDAKNMYLLAIVQDDVFFQQETGANVWSGDGLQFGICRGEERSKVGGSFIEMGLTKTLSGVELYRFDSSVRFNSTEGNLKTNTLINNPDAEYSVEVQDGKYIYRAKIPWYELLPGTKGITENTELGFSILVNDNDGAGRGYLDFAGGIGNTKDPRQYSFMTLSLGTETISQEIIDEVDNIRLDGYDDSQSSQETGNDEGLEPGVFGKHTFNGGMDKGDTIHFGMQSGTSANLSCEDDNWFIHTNANNSANTLQWLPRGNTAQNITDFWRSDDEQKIISIEFDMRNKANMTGIGEMSIYFSRIHYYNKGLRIFGMDKNGNMGLYDLGGKDEKYRFNGIKGMDPNKWYHYKYVIDLVSQTAYAELSDDENTYVIDEITAAGNNNGWWTKDIKTEFNVLAINAPNGSVDIDNIVFRQLSE